MLEFKKNEVVFLDPCRIKECRAKGVYEKKTMVIFHSYGDTCLYIYSNDGQGKRFACFHEVKKVTNLIKIVYNN